MKRCDPFFMPCATCPYRERRYGQRSQPRMGSPLTIAARPARRRAPRSCFACKTRLLDVVHVVRAHDTWKRVRVPKGWVIMKRFTLLAIAAFVLLSPTVAAAQAPFVYRPELRGWIPVPQSAPRAVTPRTPRETIARHEAMAQGYRGTRMAQAAVHCDRMVKQAREAIPREF